MAYEVIKRVRNQRYRYSVESYRDRETGRVRNRWKYLGRVEGDGATRSPSRRTGGETRERLVTAVERLLERSDFAMLTARAIATEAGLAHGTFYRYFKEKRAALEAVFGRLAEALDAALAALAGPIGSLEDERARLRTLMSAFVDASIRRPGVVRAWYAMVVADPDIAERRRERRRIAVLRLADYLRHLHEAGLSDSIDPDAIASAITAMTAGASQGILANDPSHGDVLRRGLLEVAERAVFHKALAGLGGETHLPTSVSEQVHIPS